MNVRHCIILGARVRCRIISRCRSVRHSISVNVHSRMTILMVRLISGPIIIIANRMRLISEIETIIMIRIDRIFIISPICADGFRISVCVHISKDKTP